MGLKPLIKAPKKGRLKGRVSGELAKAVPPLGAVPPSLPMCCFRAVGSSAKKPNLEILHRK